MANWTMCCIVSERSHCSISEFLHRCTKGKPISCALLYTQIKEKGREIQHKANIKTGGSAKIKMSCKIARKDAWGNKLQLGKLIPDEGSIHEKGMV